MTAPANRWKLGLFVVAGAAATIGGLTWVGMHELRREAYPAYAYFDEAVNGLEEGSPVKFRGITIGVVDEIRAAPDKRHLEVRAALYVERLRKLGLDTAVLENGDPLPHNLRAQIVMSWVTSTAFVQVDFFPDPESGPQQLPFEVPPGRQVLRTVKSTAKSLEDASREVLRELPVMATSARELVELLRTELQGVRLSEVSRQAQALLQELQRIVAEVERQGVFASVRAAADSIGDAARALHDEQSPVGTTLAELRGLAQQLQRDLAAVQLPETAAALRAAAGAAADMGGDLRSGLAQLRTTLAAIERLATMLERDPAALLRGRTRPGSPLEATK
jgi:ABC-type transporter Mla subunit MlaD